MRLRRLQVMAGCVLFGACVVAAIGLPAGQSRAQDDDRDERLALGRRSFQDNCLMCHAEALTENSRLTPKQWAAEVDKMIGWGAPVPADQKEALLAFLTQEYSPTTPPATLKSVTLQQALATIRPDRTTNDTLQGDASRGEPLFTANCATCHGKDARGGDNGTNLVDRPVLDRPADYAELMRSGRRKMPGFRNVLNPQQEADILAWLRSRPVPGP